MPATVVRIYESSDYNASIKQASDILRDGGVVVLPTETVYGAACRITSASGLGRLRELRGNPNSESGGPFTVHVAKREDALPFLGSVSEYARRVMNKLWPGPVALQFDVPPEDRARVAADLKIDESDLYDGATITLRFPSDIVAVDAISRIDKPVVFTRAGTDLATAADQLSTEVEDKVDLIVDAGPTRFGKASTIVHVGAERYKVIRAGVYDDRILERMLRTTVLFICSGNTCRSPMAEAIARNLLAEKLNLAPDRLEEKGFAVISAGSYAMPGSPAASAAIEAVKALGADLSTHRSRPLSVELIHQADVIFTMGRNHSNAVRALVPAASEKTYSLDPKGEIEDPIGSDAEVYRRLAVELQGLIGTRLDETVLKSSL